MKKQTVCILLTAAILLLGRISGFCTAGVPWYDDPCYTNFCVVVQSPSGSITFTNIAISATNICLGSGICASAQAGVNCSQVITESEWIAASTNCPNTYSTNTQCPYFVTNWWNVTGVPVDTPNGSGTSACFTPTNTGTGTITFYGIWQDSDPCTGQPIGGGTISKNVSFEVSINAPTGPPITDSTEIDLSAIKDALKALAEFFSQGNICDPSGPGSLAMTLSTETTPLCCGNKVTVSGGGSFRLGSIDCDFPFAGIPYVITANINLNASASIDISIDGTIECGDVNEVCGTVSGNGTAGGGVSVIVGSPRLLKAVLTIQGTITGNGQFCYKADGSHEGEAALCGSASVNGSVILFGGIKQSVSVPLGEGCTPSITF